MLELAAFVIAEFFTDRSSLTPIVAEFLPHVSLFYIGNMSTATTTSNVKNLRHRLVRVRPAGRNLVVGIFKFFCVGSCVIHYPIPKYGHPGRNVDWAELISQIVPAGRLS